MINATLLAGGAFSAQSIFYQGYGTFFEDLSAIYQAFSPGELAVKEHYWGTIQQVYSASSAPVLNLNNGEVSTCFAIGSYKSHLSE
ncbi:MAG: hypothetical protein R6V72_01150 [Cyclobacterium sp.]|uniref:hypothetical protein n=1 Tax=unclassified Cyclobacterium TaxID=2615055 RepID=UPI0013D08133|nr:hypothetical protein [Cyclobacterium sp. SYSU L10401]